MLGLDQHGRDTLTPQFNRGGPKTGPFAKLGSGTELNMAVGSTFESLSKNPELRRAYLRGALASMYQAGNLKVGDGRLKDAMNLLIDRDKRMITAASNKHEAAVGELRRHLAEISGETLLDSTLVDREMHEYELKRVERKYSSSHPDVIELALSTAYENGDFSAQENEISALVDTELRRRAVEIVVEGQDRQSRLAATSGIFEKRSQ